MKYRVRWGGEYGSFKDFISFEDAVNFVCAAEKKHPGCVYRIYSDVRKRQMFFEFCSYCVTVGELVYQSNKTDKYERKLYVC